MGDDQEKLRDQQLEALRVELYQAVVNLAWSCEDDHVAECAGQVANATRRVLEHDSGLDVGVWIERYAVDALREKARQGGVALMPTQRVMMEVMR